MEPQTSGLKAWQWVVTVVIIIALVIIAIVVFSNKSSAPVMDETPTVTTTSSTGVANRIDVGDQYPGNVVYVQGVSLAKDGWVVIHKDNAGQPGEIIGYSYVLAGVNPVTITLNAGKVITDGGTYYVMLHTGIDPKKFDPSVDKPLTNANGDIIMHVFKGNSSVGAGTKG